MGIKLSEVAKQIESERKGETAEAAKRKAAHRKAIADIRDAVDLAELVFLSSGDDFIRYEYGASEIEIKLGEHVKIFKDGRLVAGARDMTDLLRNLYVFTVGEKS